MENEMYLKELKVELREKRMKLHMIYFVTFLCFSGIIAAIAIFFPATPLYIRLILAIVVGPIVVVITSGYRQDIYSIRSIMQDEKTKEVQEDELTEKMPLKWNVFFYSCIVASVTAAISFILMTATSEYLHYTAIALSIVALCRFIIPKKYRKFDPMDLIEIMVYISIIGKSLCYILK